MGQGLSNESKFVKIGRLEPEIWVDKEIASKWKIYKSEKNPKKLVFNHLQLAQSWWEGYRSHSGDSRSLRTTSVFSWNLSPSVKHWVKLKKSDALVGRVETCHKICSKTLKVYPFSVEICIGGTVGNSKFWVLIFVSGPQYSYQKCRWICNTVKFP
jgi:hypothetical protein